ncbi:EAL and GGDEF domain-containing protein [Piscinibacter sakaiensis]|uniref:sensor domain-containing protein n=1 Tax=Piscinibacter sakaiensis TaxID=1547922 RepID=UPI003AAB656D
MAHDQSLPIVPLTPAQATAADAQRIWSDFNSLFEFLPIGAYRSSPDGQQLRANQALVRLNGYSTEAELLTAVGDIGREWYVDPRRREQFIRSIERDGHVSGFVAEVRRHATGERIWISENAHAVRDADGRVVFYEGTVEEITDRVNAAESVRRSEEDFRRLTSQVPGVLYRLRVAADGRLRYDFVSDGVRGLFGLTPEQVLADAAALLRMRHRGDMRRLGPQMKAAYDAGEPLDLVFRIVLADGTRKWVHLNSSAVERTDGESVRVGVMFDVSARTEAEAALRERDNLWKLALESTGDGLWDWDIATGVESFSQRFSEMYGFGGHDFTVEAAQFDQRTHPDDLEQMLRDRQAHLDGHTPAYVNEHRVRCRDGSWKWILARGMVIERDALGRPTRMIGTHTDISERKMSEALIWQQANFDSLTGLPNRRMLRDRLEQHIKKTDRAALQLALLFIDLDHFKQVNDSVGHEMGDQLLVQAAERIRGCVRGVDTVARLGGDEFTVVLSELTDPERAGQIAQKIVQSLSEGFRLGSEMAFVSASIGITLYPDDATEIDELFKHADQALYVAKERGRNRVSHFTPSLEAAAQTRRILANDLRVALQGEQFSVAYQPIVEMASGRIFKAEALIRWQHPLRGAIGPADFIPIAESTGLIVDIGDWVFRQAAEQAVRWRAEFDAGFQISVNKSPVQFVHGRGSQQRWFELLRELGLPGQSLVLEITEGLLLDPASGINEQLLELSRAGVGVSLDDFGTGFSSLSYLQRYDIDYLKIDKSFVFHLSAGSKNLALCKAIIVMAHELDMKVIAEGVETAEQRDLLAAAGCDFAQGFLYSRPVPAAEFERLLRGR